MVEDVYERFFLIIIFFILYYIFIKLIFLILHLTQKDICKSNTLFCMQVNNSIIL